MRRRHEQTASAHPGGSLATPGAGGRDASAITARCYDSGHPGRYNGQGHTGRTGAHGAKFWGGERVRCGSSRRMARFKRANSSTGTWCRADQHIILVCAFLTSLIGGANGRTCWNRTASPQECAPAQKSCWPRSSPASVRSPPGLSVVSPPAVRVPIHRDPLVLLFRSLLPSAVTLGIDTDLRQDTVAASPGSRSSALNSLWASLFDLHQSLHPPGQARSCSDLFLWNWVKTWLPGTSNWHWRFERPCSIHSPISR